MEEADKQITSEPLLWLKAPREKSCYSLYHKFKLPPPIKILAGPSCTSKLQKRVILAYVVDRSVMEMRHWSATNICYVYWCLHIFDQRSLSPSSSKDGREAWACWRQALCLEFFLLSWGLSSWWHVWIQMSSHPIKCAYRLHHVTFQSYALEGEVTNGR